MQDPLTEINGIGPAFEKALNAIGIRSFADLARQDADDLAQRLPVRVTADRIRRDEWIEQARLKAEGD
jgi:large subunit ribosomal protein L21